MPQAMIVNPHKRGSKKRKAVHHTPKKRRRSGKRKKSAGKSVVRYKRNPINIKPKQLMKRAIDQQLKPAAVGAAGALAVDAAFGVAGNYLPDVLTTGAGRHLTKGVGAVLLSVIAANFVKNETANELARGSMTVVLHDAARELIEEKFPGVALGYINSSFVAPMRGRSFSGIYTERLTSRVPAVAAGGGDGFGLFTSELQSSMPFDSSL